MSFTLKALRVNKGLSQEEAAKAIGVSSKTLSNYETGRSFPDVPVIQRIQEVYGVGYDDINFYAVDSNLIGTEALANA